MIPPRLVYKAGSVRFLDQRLLPDKIKYVPARDLRGVHKAIKDMVLRGAPLIGCGAAYGMLLALKGLKASSRTGLKKELAARAGFLKSARPTAVALFAITDRMLEKAFEIIDGSRSVKPAGVLAELRSGLEKEARLVVREDVLSTKKMAEYGVKLLKKNSVVLTHCNAGALATMGIGTALSVITEGWKKGKIKYAYADETRPYLQGARLTIWELKRGGVPSALLTDNMAAHIMKTEKVDAVFIGADRIASNGDTANKIGSYGLAVIARHLGIPFYVVAPLPTIDMAIPSGEKIHIEERSKEEVINIKGKYIAPRDIEARHPGFDVTPANLITAIITEKGIIKPVNKTNILRNIRGHR